MRVFDIQYSGGPIVATAIHDGHDVRQQVAEWLALDEATRLREEDPYTGALAAAFPTHITGRRSRFELDLNRDREHAVYRTPEDAWGLQVWRDDLPRTCVAESLANYDVFHAAVHGLLAGIIAAHGAVVVLDIHSYNHRREGPEGPCADCDGNPEVNLGVASVDRRRWGRVVDRLAEALQTPDADGQALDVRENVKFQGGHFPRWINNAFPGAACAIAIEFKKTFMDEWTGELVPARFEHLQRALRTAIPGLLAELKHINAGCRQATA